MSFILNSFVFASSSSGGGLPAGVAGLQAWYDADALTGAADSAVDTWTDRKGSFDASRISGTAPVLRHNSLNGLKQVEFGGSASAAKLTMSSALMNGASAGMYFVVLTLDADPPAGSNIGAVIDNFGNGFGFSSHHVLGDGTWYDTFGSNGRKNLGNPAPSLTTPRIVGIRSAAGDYKGFIDGTQFFTTSSNTVSFPNATRQMGYNTSGSQYLDGKVAELLIYNSALAQADREKVEGYLAHRWGLTANLPAAHPYKSVAP